MATNKVTFQLDLVGAGRTILQELALPTVLQSGAAIAARASAMTGAQGHGIGFVTSGGVGTIKRGERAIARVEPAGSLNAHQNYLAFVALQKSRDAGRV